MQRFGLAIISSKMMTHEQSNLVWKWWWFWVTPVGAQGFLPPVLVVGGTIYGARDGSPIGLTRCIISAAPNLAINSDLPQSFGNQ